MPIQWSPKNIMASLPSSWVMSTISLAKSHLAALERHKILEFLAGHAVLVVVIALVDDVFGAEAGNLLFELFQEYRGSPRPNSHTNHIFFPLQLVKHQGELVEEGGVADHVHIRVLLAINRRSRCMVNLWVLGWRTSKVIWCSKSFQPLTTALYICTGSQIRYAKEAYRVIVVGLGRWTTTTLARFHSATPAAPAARLQSGPSPPTSAPGRPVVHLHQFVGSPPIRGMESVSPVAV